MKGILRIYANEGKGKVKKEVIHEVKCEAMDNWVAFDWQGVCWKVPIIEGVHGYLDDGLNMLLPFGNKYELVIMGKTVELNTAICDNIRNALTCLSWAVGIAE